MEGYTTLFDLYRNFIYSVSFLSYTVSNKQITGIQTMTSKFISHRKTDKDTLIGLLAQGKKLYYVTDCYHQIQTKHELEEVISLKYVIKELNTCN